jgi:hypothetical protein
MSGNSVTAMTKVTNTVTISYENENDNEQKRRIKRKVGINLFLPQELADLGVLGWPEY